MSTATDVTDGTGEAQDTLPEISATARDYLLSDAGMECLMRRRSDASGGWRRCPVKRCRRARRCQGPDMICELAGGARFHATAAEIAQANARAREKIARWLEERGIYD